MSNAAQLSAWMLERLQSPATRPIYIAQINHSGATEYLSASGAVTYDGQVYTAGGMNIRSVVNSGVREDNATGNCTKNI